MKKKVAIIHDWLNGMRGGEKVLENILDLFPDADIFTLFLDEKKISDKIMAHKITSSALNKYRFIRKHYRYFLPLFPSCVESFDLRDYELIISSSHCVAKGIIPPPEAVHISYIHSPMRYIWDQYYMYFTGIRGIKKSIIKNLAYKLRVWDVASSMRVDNFIANSNFVKQRIWKYYRREASVIHPPVDTDFFQPELNPKKDYFLTVSALVPYKNNQLLIKAFNQLGEKLVVVGKGSERKKLQKMAGGKIEFKQDVSGQELKRLYQHARAYVFAGVEDFGISFVEAQACGVPVVAFKRGGVLDIVGHEKTGILFGNQTVNDIILAINQLKEREGDEKRRFKPSEIRENSLRFSTDIFNQKVKKYFLEIQ